MALVAHGAAATARRRRRSALAVALAAASVCAPLTARAQSTASLATRRELIGQADDARNAGDHARALELAQRAAAISVSPSLRLFIAQEQEALGRPAEAYVQADQCAREAEADPSLRNRAVVLRTCHALAAELHDRVARVVVRVPEAPAGVRVTIGDETVARPLWGVPYVVNPGEVTVTASAPGYRAFSQSASVAAGATREVVVALEPAVASGAGADLAGDGAARDGGDAQPPPPRDTGTRAAGPGVAPWVVVGAGGALVVAGAVLFVLRGVALGECHDGTCPSQDTIDRVYGFTTAGLVTGSVGLAAIAAGVVWAVVAAPRRPAAPSAGSASARRGSPARAGATPLFVPSLVVAGDGAHIQLGGRF